MNVTATPWGSTEDLRERMLPPGRTQAVAANARNQRERLFGATVASVVERGYEQTTVADLTRLAGVSRGAFYRHFRDRQDCFIATYDVIVATAIDEMVAEFETERAWTERLGAAFARLLELIAEQPAAAHLCLVDVYSAGPEALRGSDRLAADIDQRLRDALAESPERAGLPLIVRRAIVGGVVKIITSRVRRGLAAELPSLVPGIAGWALAYRTPPEPIRKPRVRSAPAGGPQFAPYGDAGRIFEAVAVEVADHGYQAATIEGIAAQAGASVHTFYKHFASKHDALLATFDAGLTQGFALVQPAFAQAPDWPHGMRAGLRALFSFLAGDPAWTRTALVEAAGAGAVLMARADEGIDQFATLLEPGVEPPMGAIAVEATAGAIYTLVFDHVRRAGPERLLEILPACTFVALAPFIGAEQAVAVANDGGRSGRHGLPAAR